MIEDYIGYGPESAITRQELVMITGHNDRLIRDVIGKMRKEGIPVVNFGKGYYISNDPDEIKRFVRKELSSKINDMKETSLALYEVAEGLEYERFNKDS